MEGVKGNEDFPGKMGKLDFTVIRTDAAVDIKRSCLAEYGAALFHKDNDIDRTQIPVVKLFPALCFFFGVLAHDKIRSIAVAALPGEIVTDLLHFYVDSFTISSLYNKIQDYEGRFLCQLNSF